METCHSLAAGPPSVAEPHAIRSVHKPLIHPFRQLRAPLFAFAAVACPMSRRRCISIFGIGERYDQPSSLRCQRNDFGHPRVRGAAGAMCPVSNASDEQLRGSSTAAEGLFHQGELRSGEMMPLDRKHACSHESLLFAVTGLYSPGQLCGTICRLSIKRYAQKSFDFFGLNANPARPKRDARAGAKI